MPRKSDHSLRLESLPVGIKEAAQSWIPIAIGKRRSPEGKRQCLRVLQAVAKAWSGECLSEEQNNWGQSKIKYAFFRSKRI